MVISRGVVGVSFILFESVKTKASVTIVAIVSMNVDIVTVNKGVVVAETEHGNYYCTGCGKSYSTETEAMACCFSPHSCTDHPKVKALISAATEAVDWMDPDDSKRLRTTLEEMEVKGE